MFKVIRSVSVQTKRKSSLVFTASQINVAGKVSPVIGNVRSHQSTFSSGSPTSKEIIQHSQEPTQKDRDVISHSIEEGYTTRSDEEGFGGCFTGNKSLSSEEQEKIVHANSPATMTSPRASGIPWMPKLTLEDYINLEHMDVISIQVLRKDDLIDAVRSINLMEVHRSTLQSEVVSSNASLSLNDVIKDISLLHWHECCITSIETINSVIDEVGQESSLTYLNPNPDFNIASSSKWIDASNIIPNGPMAIDPHDEDGPVIKTTEGWPERVSKVPKRLVD